MNHMGKEKPTQRCRAVAWVSESLSLMLRRIIQRLLPGTLTPTQPRHGTTHAGRGRCEVCAHKSTIPRTRNLVKLPLANGMLRDEAGADWAGWTARPTITIAPKSNALK